MAKKEKKQKSKVSGLLLLLLLSVVMLASTTYAWFTANMNVKVDEINVQVKASGGLQISADAVNWKTVLTNDDIKGYVDGKNNLPNELEPVSTALEINANGEMKMFHGAVTSNETTGAFELTTTALEDTSGTNGYYIVFDAFLKISSDEAVLRLDNGSGVVNTGESTDKGLQNAARIAFVKEGNVASEAYASAKNQKAAASTTGGNVYLWEPNFNVHHAYGVTNATQNYDNTALTSGTTNTAVNYYGISSAFSSKNLKEAYKGTEMTGKGVLITAPATNTNTTAFTSGLTINGTNDQFTGSTEAHKELFTLTKGITRVRIYMWVEGQDVDCNNDASGSDLTFTVNFSIPTGSGS